MYKLCNLSTKNISSLTFYLLNTTSTDNSAKENTLCNINAGINFALFGICTISLILTCWKFNSITVLNIRVRPTAISNILWIFYFSILGIRSMILGIAYIDNGHILEENTVIPKILFPTENVFKILEVLFLSWALEYQRKHRSRGFIQDELEQFNDRTDESSKSFRLSKKVLKTTYNIFTAQAVLCLASLAVFLLENKKDKIEYLYWTFHGCVWSLCISCIVLMFVIVLHRTIDEGPSILTKVFLFFGVVLTLPADIPLFIWKQCMFQGLLLPGPVCYITAQALLIIAVVVFMAVLMREFHRLKEVWKYFH
ncbi:uncharacterized protein LOC116301359 isoform X1 [Actinia tenebrosa]|uniref:Uncharacterized protein LOC116287233 isoform X1 n=1 Tax=Actinia tenebrosa TaxID=6105 RepID=A0A6P8IHS8_ACTTE|nr:uncharacterized protein LOC116287233 isoform X1 [Actinia tenebrosa]XP_031566259.1 uncharacterized protein LOC116301359 isoform X1 [Actinia tenebrosa]